jgi:hypothetical protein
MGRIGGDVLWLSAQVPGGTPLRDTPLMTWMPYGHVQ